MHRGPWVEGMSVGIDSLDDSHKAFCTALSEIGAALAAGDFDRAAAECRSLMELAKAHNEEEVALLRGLGYPHLAAVIAVQETMADGVARLLAQIVARSPQAAQQATRLVDDLIAYLLRSDINFKSFIQEYGRKSRLPSAPRAQGSATTPPG